MSTRARSQRSTSSSINNKLRKPPPPRVKIPEPVHWLFRTNIPRKRQSYIAASPRRRNFFGMGEVVGVLTNPASTVRSLTESKRLLDEARQELQETRERSQIRPTHTFSRLPGFFPRKHEQQAIQRALEGEPSFTVLFGAPSVGKTALLREILSHPRYHVLHFDLRIAGFADIESLYTSLSIQMEGYFEELARKGGWYEEDSAEPVKLSDSEIQADGWDTFEAEALAFKHERINIQRRAGGPDGETLKYEVRPSDIARLMELFQSSLLHYREFVPGSSSAKAKHRRQASEDTVVAGSGSQSGSSRKRWFLSSRRHERYVSPEPEHDRPNDAVEEERRKKRVKRVPVLFFDEAHKLPHLIPSSQTMQTLLDSTLVLTKQDRLCHVVHATSDPFYQGWLSRVGVLWYCKLISIGDMSKSEMRAYFRERVQPRLADIPPNVRRPDFETLYDAFGGKVAHWYDFITDYVNSGGTLTIKQCSHFLQAHALLNLHIIHSSQAPGGGFEGTSGGAATASGSIHNTANMSTEANRASPETFLHPSIGAAGFRMYQATSANGTQQNLNHAAMMHMGMGNTVSPLIASFTPYEGVGTAPEFSPMQLLKIMSRLTSGGLNYLPYFHLCRELGARAVDGMIRGKVVDVKWTDGIPGAVDASRRPVSMAVNNPGSRVGNDSNYGFQAQAEASSTMMPLHPPSIQQQPQVSMGPLMGLSISGTGTGILSGSTTAVDFSNGLRHPYNRHRLCPPKRTAVDSMMPMLEDEIAAQQQTFQNHQYATPVPEQHTTLQPPPPPFSPPPRHYGPIDIEYQDDEDLEDEEDEVIGPKLYPVSPIMWYAMREVIKEYEDDRSVSEYASLSDVEEY
ncbi:hypothetical protein EST38_g4981 [Candolleomyces aberdarensis]|uniref:AAA+ ATPase domain-containing protein n=1 Tax=Candolleomyces aberdarensis TaxID=2316362 RepID=A0A4Q2DPV8_9AGAR|nr:hypothetical protein EST38_g4981 [Candolleomyces aberdarensis]